MLICIAKLELDSDLAKGDLIRNAVRSADMDVFVVALYYMHLIASKGLAEL